MSKFEYNIGDIFDIPSDFQHYYDKKEVVAVSWDEALAAKPTLLEYRTFGWVPVFFNNDFVAVNPAYWKRNPKATIKREFQKDLEDIINESSENT